MVETRRAKEPGKQVDRGITGITVCGFKSLVEPCHIEIRPLTILAGANSSGKSSIVQPLLLLKQTLETAYDPGPLNISGPNVQFTEVDQILPRVPGVACPKKLSVTLTLDRAMEASFCFAPAERKGLDIEEVSYKRGNRVTVIRPSMTHAEIEKVVSPEDNEIARQAIARARGAKWGVIRNRFFLFFGLTGGKDLQHGFYWGASQIAIFDLQRCVEEVIHVPGLRGNPERSYRITGIGPRYPGLFNEYVASIIRYWKDKHHTLLDDLGASLRDLGLTWKVEARLLDAARAEIQVARMPKAQRGGAHDMVSIADVGFGVSQVLPVLVALLAAKPDQVVYIEQPEIHLHPRAQVAMAGLLGDAANRGVRLIVETHSSLLLLALQTLVAEGRLGREKVILHWFTRRPQDGVTTIQTAKMDETGAYGPWPVDFGDIELKAEKKYLDVAESRLKRSRHAAQ